MKSNLIILLALFSYVYGVGQTKDLSIGKIHTIHSKVLNEDREIAVFTPAGYETNEKKYPVLYLLDGEWNFNFVSSLVDKLAGSGDAPEMIVVGIINTNRSKDLTPPGTNDNKNRYGGANEFLNFLTSELQPWVKTTFRTHPYQLLAGHSFGGLFSLYSMMQQEHAFQAYIALSPSLGRNDEQQVKQAETFFTKQDSLNASLYVAIGNEGGFTKTSTEAFIEILERHRLPSFRYQFEALEEESHVSITITGFLNGIKFIYKGFNPERLTHIDEIFQLEKHYENLSKRFGYPIIMPEEYFQKFVKEQIGERELDYALFILSKYERAYPNSIHLLVHYADTFLLKGDFQKAKEYYLKLKEAGVEHAAINRILQEIEDK